MAVPPTPARKCRRLGSSVAEVDAWGAEIFDFVLLCNAVILSETSAFGTGRESVYWHSEV
jgi:hypothetical protein